MAEPLNRSGPRAPDVSAQGLGALTLGAGTSNVIAINSNGGSGATLTLAGGVWTRGAGGDVLLDYSSAVTGGVSVAAVPTGTGGHRRQQCAWLCVGEG